VYTLSTMARSSRLDWKSAVHHVMARGIEKKAIFKDDSDRAKFVSRIERCVAETGVSIYAWSLMPNHIHMLIRTCNKPLAKFMQKLLTGHANYFNKKYDRVGYLFQNRYKSILVQAEKYLLKLVRYIHLNPVKASIVGNLEMLKRYPWTGHPGLLFPGYYPWQETGPVLNTFIGNKMDKIRQYERFIEDPEEISYQDGRFDEGSYFLGANGLIDIDDSNEEEIRAYFHYRVLGESEFAQEIYKKIQRKGKGQLRNRGFEHDSVIKILEYVSEKWKIPKTALTSKGRTRSVSGAREYLCYVFVNILGMTLVDSGRILNLSSQGVHAAAERFLPDYNFDKEIKDILSRV